jgi:hypothetical protein
MYINVVSYSRNKKYEEIYLEFYLTGTFFHYDPINDKNGPAVRGYSAGSYYDGSVRKAKLFDPKIKFMSYFRKHMLGS